MSEDCVRFYVAQLSSALSFLHEMGIMHRLVHPTYEDRTPFICSSSLLSDVKPDNILLDERGNAHLTDFNIAVHYGERKLTGVAGSMAYMAPEYALINPTSFRGANHLKNFAKEGLHLLHRLVVARRLRL